MSRPLPSMSNLQAFECAARLGSFTQAAFELSVTQAAVSCRIKVLEQQLGTRLFHRRNRRVELTHAGESYLASVSECLRRLKRASDSLREFTPGNSQTLRVLAMQSFAMLWLVPRIGHFRKLHPEIDLNIVTRIGGLSHLEEHDFHKQGFDATVIYTDSEANLPNLDTELLERDVAIPVCSASVFSPESPLRAVKDLRAHTLIHAQTWPKIWKRWLTAAGAPRLTPASHLRLENSLLATHAALNGAGVAMGHKVLTSEYLQAGRLIAPLDIELPVEHGYYFACCKVSSRLGTVSAFRAWLRAELNRARHG